ncbi:phage portal protein [Bifidobacterium sp. SO1]|uniref:phage portal protein n=1 Tax=Bifidobacterium sp. SO1 TaxID=2809029 RepID=UPI001C301CBF|nr:phage portal protein [Bifidobacterium sp. SO1]
MLLTELTNGLVNRIPTLCTLKTFYDGKELVPTKSIPKSTNQSGYAVYQRFTAICQLDLAKAIADAVIHRQRPTGFRLISDKTMRSTEADDMWSKCRMELKSRQLFHDLSVYGNAYAMVHANEYPSYITVLSPWTTYVSSDEDSAINYTYSSVDGKEYIALYKLERNEDGSVSRIFCRVASNETDKRSLLDENNEEEIYGIANDDSKLKPSLSPTFEWEGAAEYSYPYAEACQCLPIVRMHASGGKGQFEPHIPALSSIDQQRFQRFCIQELQAFKQRAVSMSNMPQYYKESDPQVRDGLASAGDKIDYKDLFQQGPDALWLVPGDAKFWESGVTDITPLITAVASDIKHLAASSGTPLDILSPDVSGSAEGAQLKREGLVFKVEDMNARANDGFTRLLRMALTAGNDNKAPEQRFETVWKPINPPSQLEQAQTANYSKGVLPAKTNMRRSFGMTEIEIAEAMQDLMDTQFAQALAAENQLIEGKTSRQVSPTLPDETGFGSNLTLDETGTASSDTGQLEPDNSEQTAEAM